MNHHVIEYEMAPIDSRPGYFGVPGVLELPVEVFHRCPDCERNNRDGEGYVWDLARDPQGDQFLYCVNCIQRATHMYILGQIDVYSMTYICHEPPREINRPPEPPPPPESYADFLARIRDKYGDMMAEYHARIVPGRRPTRKAHYAQEDTIDRRKQRKGRRRDRHDPGQRGLSY